MIPFFSALPLTSWLKLAGAGILVIAAGILVFVVIGWKDKAAGYDAMKAERDNAVATEAALTKNMTGELTSIAGKLDAIDKWRSQLSTDIQHDGASVDAAVSNFKRATANANAKAPGDADDRLVRDQLHRLLGRQAPAPDAAAPAGAAKGGAKAPVP